MPNSNVRKPSTTLALRLLSTTLLLLLAASTTTCAPRVSSQRVVVVDTSEIQKLDENHYKVSKGWLVNRMKIEAGLKAALDRCQSQLDTRVSTVWHDRFLRDSCRRCPECCVRVAGEDTLQ